MRKLRARDFRTVPGIHYGTPKELWDFESDRPPGTPKAIALEFLRLHADVIEIDDVLHSLSVRRELQSLGAHHVIFQQKFQRKRIHRAYVTLHVRRDGGVYLIKNRAVPSDFLARAKDGPISATRAETLARRAVSHARGRLSILGRPEKLWYPSRRLIHPAWRVRVQRTRPRSEWLVYVSAERSTHLILVVWRSSALLGVPWRFHSLRWAASGDPS